MSDLIPVRLDCGLVVWHTPWEYETFIRGVDREAALLHDAPLELDTDTDDDGGESVRPD